MKGIPEAALQGGFQRTGLVCGETALTQGQREQNLLFLTPQGKMEAALFRTATLLLDDRMPSGMNQGTDQLGSRSRTPVLLGHSSLLHRLAFICYFLLFPFARKTDQSPGGNVLPWLPACVHPGPVPLSLSFANQEDVK